MMDLLQIHDLNLISLAEQVKENSRLFNRISFTHVYRELNTKADALSKDGLSLTEGILHLEEFLEDNEHVSFQEAMF